MIELADASATNALGSRIGRALAAFDAGLVMALAGELGAGKTALARAALRALGHAGAVVSPSYTLVEPYAVAGRCLHHLDLYRLGDPSELEFLGVREIDPRVDWLLIEWAERGIGFLPPQDVVVTLDYAPPGRRARIEARSAHGSAFQRVLENVT